MSMLFDRYFVSYWSVWRVSMTMDRWMVFVHENPDLGFLISSRDIVCHESEFHSIYTHIFLFLFTDWKRWLRCCEWICLNVMLNYREEQRLERLVLLLPFHWRWSKKYWSSRRGWSDYLDNLSYRSRVSFFYACLTRDGFETHFLVSISLNLDVPIQRVC